MLLFTDIFTGKEILTDSYKMTLEDDFVYVVETCYKTKHADQFGDEMFGGNPSAEEAAEELEEGQCDKGFDCIINHKETVEEFGEVPEYKKFVKTVLPAIVKAAKSKMDPEKHNEFKKKLSLFFSKGCGKTRFSNFQIFFSKDAIDFETGELRASPILVDADETGMKAKAYYFKDLMAEVKQ